MEALIPLVVVIGIFGTPVIAVLTNHHRKIVEMKLKQSQQADQSVLAEIQALRQQMSELRDTTTKYDMSFDAALQRLESRVGHLEGRVTNVEQGTSVTR